MTVHTRQTEIEAVGEEARHQYARVGNRLAASQMGEAVDEQRPIRHLRQQVGDANVRQHRIEARSQDLGFGWRRFLEGRDLQHAPLERDVRQQPAFRLGVDHRQPLVEEGTATRNEALEIGIDRDRQGAALQQLPLSLAGDEALLEGAVSAAPHDPNLTRTQPVAQLRQHAELIVALVDRSAG